MDNVMELDDKSSAAEAYRSIRTNINFCNIDNKMKTILFTSTKKNEGKTTMVSNVAYSFSKLEKGKTLLIDLDLRSPSIHKIFKVSNAYGIIDYLVDNRPLEKCIHKIDENMHVLTTGGVPANPTELLSSEKMKDFLKNIKLEYKYIFIDSPPVGSVSDGVVISGLVDGVVYIIGSKEIDLSHAQVALESLRKCDAKIIGAVVNKYDLKKSNYGYYEYYGYYYGEGGKKKHKHKKRHRLFGRSSTV